MVDYSLRQNYTEKLTTNYLKNGERREPPKYACMPHTTTVLGKFSFSLADIIGY